MPAGFLLRLAFAPRRHHDQARVTYLAGEFPCLMIDAPADETDSRFCRALPECLPICV